MTAADAHVRTAPDPRTTDEPAEPEPIRLDGRHPGRRRRATALVAGGALALLAAGVVAWRSGDDAGPSTGSADEPATTTAEVTIRDLEERTELDGTLGYGDTSQLALSAQGTVTWLPPEGSVVDRGQAVAQVDDRVVPLLFGDRPLWRELGSGVEDGPDVELVEANLVALGVVTADELTVDQEWTSATTDALEDWQEALGLEETGRLAPGAVAVQPGAVRVAAHVAELGGQAGGPILEVAGTTRMVTVDLEATRQGMVAVGQTVDVELPDGTVVPGTVATVGTVAETPEGAEGDPTADTTPTIEVTVSLDDPAAAGALDQAPVTVSVVTIAAQGVTAVPADALLALAEGGYAVERPVAGGGTELVPVEIGAFADGWVQVTGDLAEGDDVVVPE
jgi:Putative peptidoglycan binding domain/HlyD family secretion protein